MNSLKFYTLIFALMLSVPIFAQSNKYASILVNKPATTEVNLSQSIDPSGEMLVLKTNQKIYKISVLFHSKKETLDIEFGHTEAKIPLYLFEKGNITIAVHPEQGNIYPIALTIHKTVPKPQGADDDFEKSILVASLPEEEQFKRHLKKRPKKDNTRVANVAPKNDNSAERQAKERAQRERIKAEADRAKKEQALVDANRIKKERELADAKKKEAKAREAKEKLVKAQADKEKRELAQIEANKERIKKEAIAAARAKELQAEKAAKAKANKLKLEQSKQDNTVAKVDNNSKDKELNVKNVKYNISELENNELEKQSREEYRKENLRPNGKKYDDD